MAVLATTGIRRPEFVGLNCGSLTGEQDAHQLDIAGTDALVPALRHTLAMDLLNNGASIVEVQTLLGHESLATTRRCRNARPHELRDTVQSLTSSRALTADP